MRAKLKTFSTYFYQNRTIFSRKVDFSKFQADFYVVSPGAEVIANTSDTPAKPVYFGLKGPVRKCLNLKRFITFDI